MREFRILKRANGMHVYQFFKQGIMKWELTSYILFKDVELSRIVSNWLDNEVHPEYKHI